MFPTVCKQHQLFSSRARGFFAVYLVNVFACKLFVSALAEDNDRMTSTSSTTTVRKSYGNRKISTCAEDYYRLVKKNNAPTVGGGNTRKSEEIAKLIKYIDENIVGKNSAFLGPFGRRKGQ